MEFLKKLKITFCKYSLPTLLLFLLGICTIGLMWDIAIKEIIGWAFLIFILHFLFFQFFYIDNTQEFKRSSYRALNKKNSLSRFGLFIKIFPIFLTLFFAISGERISQSTRLTFVWENNLDWFVLIFWILLSIWAILLPMHLTRNDKINTERIEELLNSIHNSPDKTLFTSYPDLYTKMLTSIDDIAIDNSKSKEEKNIDQIKVILKTIAEIVKYFSPHADNIEHIGANIWLIFSKKDQNELIQTLPPQITFHCTYQEDDVIGVLILLKDLIISGNKESSNFELSSDYIALPLPRSSTLNQIQYALPGSPKAAFDGLSVYNDISLMQPDLKDFKASTQNSINDYFSTGAGKNIKSFASIRIGDETNPIGVVSVDSMHTDILGDKQFYPTFFALIEPVLAILKPKVLKFRETFVQKNDFPWIN